MECCSTQGFHGAPLLSHYYYHYLRSHSQTIFRRGMQNSQSHLVTGRGVGTTFQVLSGKGNPKTDVIMVPTLEAKRLAAKQMQEIQAQEEFKRRRHIEAINGAWAVIGLTAGLIIEGRTGNSVPTQLAGYWCFIISFFARIFSSRC